MGPSGFDPILVSSIHSQSVSLTNDDRAANSASQVNVAVADCNLDLHKLSAPL